MTTRARARGTEDLPRAEYRAYVDTEGEWNPGTVMYDGETLRVLAMDDGTTQFVYDTRALRGLGEGHAGDRVLDAGQVGTLVQCPTCDGHGTLFQPDADQPAITAPAPAVSDLDHDAYRLLEIIERTRHRHGIYLVGTGNSPLLHVFQRSGVGRDDWYSPRGKAIRAASLHALERAGLVVSYAPDAGPLEPPPSLITAITQHRDIPEGAAFTITAPAPTSNPHETPDDDRKAVMLRRALAWLYDTEQPAGAMISHHGVGLWADPAVTPTRRLNLAPRAGERQLPIISVQVAYPITMRSAGGEARGPRNPLAPGEIEQWADVLRDAGHEVLDVWSGHPDTHGGIQLARPAHPSLLAALDLYGTGCTEHPNGDRGNVFCGCGWSKAGQQLLVPPAPPHTMPQAPTTATP